MTTMHLDELEALYASNAASDIAFSPVEVVAVSREQLFSRSRFPKLNWVAELKIMAILFAVVFSGFFFFTNAKLLIFTFNDAFSEEIAVPETMHLEPEHTTANLEEKKEKMLALEAEFAQIQQQQRQEKPLALTMQEFLDKKQITHSLEFNTLPPTNRLIIPDLNINVPLVDIPAKGGEDFSQGNFDEELMQGVVKYPTTPTPGSQGNALLFGHSSTEWRKHNEYGFVFRNLPKLKAGQRFQVLWNGQLSTYEMIERKVVLPKHVADYYHEFQDQEGSFVTLMGCYPIGSDAKRMMVVAKKV